MKIIPVGLPGYHHQSGPDGLNPDFVSAIDTAALADLLVRERWKGQCEIIPDYMPRFPDADTRPKCVVRFLVRAQNENQEDSYCYLRYSKGPRQGFAWDIYGDDLHTVELALLALHQAPAPTYCGPAVFKFNLTNTPDVKTNRLNLKNKRCRSDA